MSNTKQLCTFYLDSCYIGVGVQRVQHVIRYQEMTKAPMVNDRLLLVLNIDRAATLAAL